MLEKLWSFLPPEGDRQLSTEEHASDATLLTKEKLLKLAADNHCYAVSLNKGFMFHLYQFCFTIDAFLKTLFLVGGLNSKHFIFTNYIMFHFSRGYKGGAMRPAMCSALLLDKSSRS